MMSQTKHVTTLERHCLLMPFEYLRCCNHKLNSSLVYSMEQYGQLMPVIAIPTPNQECSWTLIDGHSRLRALKQLDKELVTVEIWDCSPTEALVNIIKYNSSRPLALIEEALLISNCSPLTYTNSLASAI